LIKLYYKKTLCCFLFLNNIFILSYDLLKRGRYGKD